MTEERVVMVRRQADSVRCRQPAVGSPPSTPASIGLAALVAFAAAGCDSCAPAAFCSSTAQCPGNLRCFEGRCWSACAEDGQCGAAESCLYGACLPIGAACGAADDCLAIETCAAGSCRLLCGIDADCPSGHGCRDGICLPHNGPNPDAAVDASAVDRLGSDRAGPDRRTSDGPVGTDSPAPADRAQPDQSCSGLSCDGGCDPHWSCCDTGDCALPTSTCINHLCIGTLRLQETTDTRVVDDTWISSYAPSTNYANDGTLYVRGSNNHVALLRFDTSALPVDATVTAAQLKLYNISLGNGCWIVTGVYEMLTAWSVTETNWTGATASENWAVAGCTGAGTDRAASPTATHMVYTANAWYEFSIDELVRKWVAQPADNFGVTVQAHLPQCDHAHAYYSSNNIAAFQDKRPLLVIDYIEP
jgi:hypothetical protein